MSSILVGALGLLVLLAVILLNVPIAAAMALVGAIGTLVLDANAAVFSLFGTATVQALSSQDLIVIPLFILLGGFAIVAGLSTEIYRLAHVWFGHLRGGLATTATMVQVALPEMRRRGYSDALIAGSIAGGGTLGSLIPPSVIMVVYAILTQQSVLDLFRAAIMPGIVAVLLYFGAIRLFMLWNPGDGQVLPRASWRERAQATGQARLRDTLAGAIPPDIERKVRRNAVLERDDYIRWQDVLARHGWLAAGWPAAYGGPGFSPTRRYPFEQAYGATYAPPPVHFGVTMVGPIIFTYGDAAQKARFLPDIRENRVWRCQGYSEPQAGSDLAALRISASLLRFAQRETPQDAVRDWGHAVSMGWQAAASAEDHCGFGLGLVGPMLIAESPAAALSPLVWRDAALCADARTGGAAGRCRPDRHRRRSSGGDAVAARHDAGLCQDPQPVRAAAWDRARLSGARIAEEAIQMHGGIGMTEECRVGTYVKRILRNEAAGI